MITIIFFSVAILIFIIIAICFYFSNIVLYPKTWNYEKSLENEVTKGRVIEKDFNSLHKEEIYISSPLGYQIHGIFFPNSNSTKTIILCHGITCTLFTSVKYMGMFLKRNFNVLIYDHRNHGKSGGKYTSYGFYEKYDLKICTDWVINRLGKDSTIGIHGESMGAATVLQNAYIDKRISFFIVDCPYSDLVSLFKIRLKADFHLPYFPILCISSFISKLRAGFYYSEISPIKHIINIDVPIFFIHGKDDTYIPPQMSIDMYNAKNGIKKLYIAQNAKHAEAFLNNREEYDKLVGDFLNEINIT